MTDVMQGLVSEAKKSKFSSICPSLSDEDVVSVWDNVSGFIERQMGQQKGVNIPGLGIFTFSQKKLDVGNNKYILIQRPVFLLSEKFAQTHGLNYTKHHVTGQIPVVQLNFAALSFDSPFSRDAVEACVKEVLGALARSVGARKNVEFSFNGIGKLQIRDSKTKMKFYKEFVNSMDGSGRMIDSMKDRPGTVDSVMSEGRTPTRAHTSNTMLLPRITGGLGLEPEGDTQRSLSAMPAIREEEEVGDVELQQKEEGEEYCFEPFKEEGEGEGVFGVQEDLKDDFRVDAEDIAVEELPEEKKTNRPSSRVAVPVAMATGVCFADDLLPPPAEGRPSSLMKSSPSPLILKRSLSPLNLPGSPKIPLPDGLDFGRSKSVDQISFERFKKYSPPLGKIPTPLIPSQEVYTPSPPSTACGHANAGQELCYLCHQRDRRNIPVSFKEERQHQDQEEDKFLQRYQDMKDTEAMLQEQEKLLAKRHENQKMAAFNVGVSEAIKAKKTERPMDFHSSYIFQKRPLTPPRFIKQEQLHKDLHQQVTAKDQLFKKRKSDEEFLERLEQVQLAEDLAAQREQYLKDKAGQQEQYKRALSAQLKFKPLPIPGRVSDSSEPVFGKNDMNSEKMAERRRQAHDLYKEQLATVEQRKREAILKRLQEQKDEEQMLKRTKEELLDDRAKRYERLFHNRKHLEDSWSKADHNKKSHEANERLQARSPGKLVHEQCDKYKRCGQCKRRLHNCGESNIWRESRYIPGSRLMV